MTIHDVETHPRRAPARILRDPLPGTGYRAVRRIGAGSASEVFEAIAPDGARCAVKVLRSIYADTPDAVFRMEQEGYALAGLDHPSLVRVLDVGTTSTGRPYFVMPLVDGETVRDRLNRRGPFPAALACALVAEMLEGLDVAHRAGIVHRDVKPANLFLPHRAPGGPVPRCVLLDFGIAKLLEGPGRPTTEAKVLGSPRYVAPEQILGGCVDARTDVYAAGLTLFEMIAGRSPYDVETPLELMRAHLEAKPRSLLDFAPVSRDLAHVIDRAIAKAPARRWPSARAFAAVLDRVAAREIARCEDVEIDVVLDMEVDQ
ncbi:serine/threonine protein kinase [Minicystis rosea]|nr:serine/threonine protein kinase [Minicystis rosea]